MTECITRVVSVRVFFVPSWRVSVSSHTVLWMQIQPAKARGVDKASSQLHRCRSVKVRPLPVGLMGFWGAALFSPSALSVIALRVRHHLCCCRFRWGALVRTKRAQV